MNTIYTGEQLENDIKSHTGEENFYLPNRDHLLSLDLYSNSTKLNVKTCPVKDLAEDIVEFISGSCFPICDFTDFMSKDVYLIEYKDENSVGTIIKAFNYPKEVFTQEEARDLVKEHFTSIPFRELVKEDNFCIVDFKQMYVSHFFVPEIEEEAKATTK